MSTSPSDPGSGDAPPAPPSFPRPLPQTEGDAAPFWQALARGVVELQRCDACRRHVFPPRPFCPHCHARGLSWEAVESRSRLLTWSIVHRPTHPWFFGQAPYVYALVELPCGVRLPTRLVDVPHEHLAVGLEVEPRFERVDEKVTLLHFGLGTPA